MLCSRARTSLGAIQVHQPELFIAVDGEPLRVRIAQLKKEIDQVVNDARRLKSILSERIASELIKEYKGRARVMERFKAQAEYGAISALDRQMEGR